MARSAVGKAKTTTVAPEEVAHFSAMADEWWDLEGKFKPLHQLNPVRIGYIRERASAHFKRNPKDDKPFNGLNVLDIGCGGGLLSEPMASLGACVTAIDASQKNIHMAKLHAGKSGLKINYQCALPEELTKGKKRFDMALNMEVVEHVANLDAFIKASSELVKPGGAMVVSTLNRTIKSFLLAKVASEYILRWLPAGTHDWNKFVKPSELKEGLGFSGVEVTDLTGVSYNPLARQWSPSRDLEVNYLAFAVKN